MKRVERLSRQPSSSEAVAVRHSSSRWRMIGIGIAVVAVVGVISWATMWRPSLRSERQLQLAQAHFERNEFEEAETVASTAHAIDPGTGEAALLAARAARALGEYERAVAHADLVAATDPKRFAEAALLRAEIYRAQLRRFHAAELAYRDALEALSDDAEANGELATLLALCGRWREAVPHALRVVRGGKATDLVVLLSRENGTVSEPGALEAARRADPKDPLPLIGLAWHAASEEHPDDAIALLTSALELQPQLDAAYVALGEQLWEADRHGELPDWYAGLPESAKQLPEAWLVLARAAEAASDRPGAIRGYLEASRAAPESRVAIAALARLLAAEGDMATAGKFAIRLDELQSLESAQNRVLHSSDFSSITPLLELSEAYERVGRLWEAFGWCRMAVHLNAFDSAARNRLAGLRKKTEGLPLRRTVDASNIASNVDAAHYPLPTLASPPPPANRDEVVLQPVSFRDDARAANISFRYFNGASETPTKRMFEFTGGGIGVLDFDVDGFSDVYFTQGQEWPPKSSSNALRDGLFRNLGGQGFAEVAERAGVFEDRFGQGVTIGDYDSDGFPDVYVANIGENRLRRNNGDGTFEDATELANVAGEEWSTSCVLADLDGDGLSDLYVTNYLTGDEIFQRICRDGNLSRMCMPFDFEGQRDRLWKNLGDGRFEDVTATMLAPPPDGKGLGVAVWDSTGTGRASLLVANDTTPNHFYEPPLDSSTTGQLTDQSVASGLALNADGKATGSMGIALGDVDDDGRLDAFITNFLAEPNTFYSSPAGGVFEDRTRAVGLHAPSIDVLGFGTQFLDADLDGRLELFVANGHIDDLRDLGKPYEMPAQLFRWDGSTFLESAATEPGSYFQKRWLGRAAARLDWNRDGRDDLLVGHLYADSALLTNTTTTEHRFVQLKLTGTQSNRDAIGTTVVARRNGSTKTFQITAGDGYQASNERRLTIGTGNDAMVDELIIRWPSGLERRFEDVETSSFLHLVEGRNTLLPVNHSP